MNILPLFQIYENLINNLLSSNPYFHELESKIIDIGDELTIDILREIIELIDITFKNSKERKDKYYVKATRQRTIITSIGLLTFTKTYYVDKLSKEHFSFIEEVLGLPKWSKMTLCAEVALLKMSLDTNMEYASKNAIRNHCVTRQTISTKIKQLNINQPPDITRIDTPNTLYIEIDEIHANLQDKLNKSNKNKIVPACVIHEGHKEHFVNRKALKNKFYISSANLSYQQLWYEVYDFVSKRYDIDKIKYIFISGDGLPAIKSFNEVFPYAIFVLDKFHYRKAINYIFKHESLISPLADQYLRNNRIEDFKLLVKYMIDKYPHQRKYMIEKQNYLIKNISGIVNQHHPEYKCPASMEGHISNVFARHITSRPFAFSNVGLENKIQLIVFNQNGYHITPNSIIKFKNEDNYYRSININSFKSNFHLQANQFVNPDDKYLSLTYSIPSIYYKGCGTRTLIKSSIKFKR